MVQFVHLVLERQRQLRHVDRLLADAVAEALNWIQVPLSAEAMNAATYDRQVAAVVEREARHGSGPTQTVPSQVSTAQSVLLQPDLPGTLEELRAMLPGIGDRTLLGYRRRAWQRTAERIFHDAGHDLPPNDGMQQDRDLMIVQRSNHSWVGNWPAGVARPPHPLRDRPRPGHGFLDEKGEMVDVDCAECDPGRGGWIRMMKGRPRLLQRRLGCLERVMNGSLLLAVQEYYQHAVEEHPVSEVGVVTLIREVAIWERHVFLSV